MLVLAIFRHQKACGQNANQSGKVQSWTCNPDGTFHNWDYKPDVVRLELCRLIARLDLPFGVGETNAFEEYIQHAHNPHFSKASS